MVFIPLLAANANAKPCEILAEISAAPATNTEIDRHRSAQKIAGREAELFNLGRTGCDYCQLSGSR